MIDIRLIREQPELVLAGAKKKRIALDLDPLRELDARLTAAQQELDRTRSEQNAAAKAIGQAPPAERAKLAEGAKAGKALLKQQEEAYGKLELERRALLLRVPNIPAAEVPEGKDDSENVEVKRWGEPRKFEFEPRDHIALGEGQDWIDVERGARIAGSRNYFLKGDLSLLEGAVHALRARSRWSRRASCRSRSRRWCAREIMVGTGYFPGGEEQAYRCDARDDLCLVGTAEVPVTALHQDEILSERELPKRYVALSLLLPPRGRDVRQGHARPVPRAPVPEGRAGRDRRRRPAA